MNAYKSTLLITLLALGLAACALAATPTAAPLATPLATPDLTGAGETLVCLHPLLPADVAATWEYVLTDPAQQVITLTNTIEDVQPAGFSLQSMYQIAETSFSNTSAWKCAPEGLTAETPILGGQWLTLLLPNATFGASELVTNDGVTLPAVINPGDTWTQTLTTRTPANINGQSETLQTTYTFTFTARRSEALRVRALSETAMLIEVTGRITATRQDGSSLPDIELSSAQWYVPAVGLAKSVSIIKIAGQPNRVEMQELVSFITTR